MTKPIKYKSGELHGVQLDDNTVALIMPTDYAMVIRDIMWFSVVGSESLSRRKYASLIARALNGLSGVPFSKNRPDDMAGMIDFKDNPAVHA